MTSPKAFKFRLYVAGDGPNSVQAISNLNAICRDHLPNRHEIEVVDVLREPLRALADLVIMTPLLVKLSPAPVNRIGGSLKKREAVLHALGLPDSG